MDPFRKQNLLLISTGLSVEDKASYDILNAFQIGLKAMKTFITERLSERSERSLLNSIKRQKLPNFENLHKKQVTKNKSMIISLKASKNLFSKFEIINQNCTIDLKRMFAFPIAHLSLSTAKPDGTLRNTAKSLLIHKLEEDTGMANVMRVDHTLR